MIFLDVLFTGFCPFTFMTDGGPLGYNCTAAQGNYLEAINLSFNGKYKWKNKYVYVCM